MSYKLKVVNASETSNNDAATKSMNENNIVVLPNGAFVTKEYYEAERQLLQKEKEKLNEVIKRKFNKEELLDKFAQIIDKANEFIDKEDVQKIRKMFIEAGTDKVKQQVVITEALGLHDKYCSFGDTVTQTALMMATTGNSII